MQNSSKFVQTVRKLLMTGENLCGRILAVCRKTAGNFPKFSRGGRKGTEETKEVKIEEKISKRTITSYS
jgi:hypothetical protein